MHFKTVRAYVLQSHIRRPHADGYVLSSDCNVCKAARIGEERWYLVSYRLNITTGRKGSRESMEESDGSWSINGRHLRK